ncbi:DUF6906 family protein [Bacillus cereus]
MKERVHIKLTNLNFNNWLIRKKASNELYVVRNYLNAIKIVQN